MKQCSKCGQTKPLTEFHPSPNTTDGRISQCKACYNARCREHRQRNLKAARQKERSRYHLSIPKPLTPVELERRRQRYRQHYHSHKLQHGAKDTVKFAVRRAEKWASNQLIIRRNTGPLLFRPPHCPWCAGTSPYPIEAHHYRGYDPKDWIWATVWVCRTCHRKIDVMAREAVLDGFPPIDGFKRFLREHGVIARNKDRKPRQESPCQGYNDLNIPGETNAT